METTSSTPGVSYSQSGDHRIVVLDYEAILDPSTDLTDAIEEAFGFSGLGLLTVRGVPKFAELRQKLLPLAHKFANLPEEVKEKTVHKDSFYSFGWSHGKEMMSKGKPDFSKGSYYNNPIMNRPIEDEEIIKKYAPFAHPNIWPTEDLPELEPAFLELGRLMVDIGLLVARQCDKFVSKKCPGTQPEKLHNIIKTCRTPKGRLLHYFPLSDELCDQGAQPGGDNNDADFSSWCGWHNDHGSLTALVPAAYYDRDGNEVPNPDPTSGLYIKSRSGQVVKGVIPADHIAFQIGETACVHSGGWLYATPHCVRGATGPKAKGVSRETFAVFMEPEWAEAMNVPEGRTPGDVTRGAAASYLPAGVPTLESRWKPEQDFGQFTETTLKAYY